MQDWFGWNGVKCTTLGIRVTRQPAITRARERLTYVTAPGRSGSLTVPEGEDVYDEPQHSAECCVPSQGQPGAIPGWLRGG